MWKYAVNMKAEAVGKMAISSGGGRYSDLEGVGASDGVAAGEASYRVAGVVPDGVPAGAGVGAGLRRRRNQRQTGRRKEVSESKSRRMATPTPWVVRALRR